MDGYKTNFYVNFAIKDDVRMEFKVN